MFPCSTAHSLARLWRECCELTQAIETARCGLFVARLVLDSAHSRTWIVFEAVPMRSVVLTARTEQYHVPLGIWNVLVFAGTRTEVTCASGVVP